MYEKYSKYVKVLEIIKNESPPSGKKINIEEYNHKNVVVRESFNRNSKKQPSNWCRSQGSYKFQCLICRKVLTGYFRTTSQISSHLKVFEE